MARKWPASLLVVLAGCVAPPAPTQDAVPPAAQLAPQAAVAADQPAPQPALSSHALALLERPCDAFLPRGDVDVAYTFCQQELAAQGYPAAGISTTNSAADLVDLMAALGYPAHNL